MKDFTVYLILILSLSGSITKAQKSPYDKNKLYTVNELQFDLAILKDALVKTHPGLFWFQTEKEFENSYNTLKNDINHPMTEMKFYDLLTLFVGNIKCSHTEIMLSEAFDKNFFINQKIIPFWIKLVGSKMYLSRNLTTDTTFRRGEEIISINGVASDSILRFIEPRAWGDGFTTCYGRVEDNFEPLAISLFNSPDTYVLETKDPTGNSKSLEVDALPFTTLVERNKKYETDSPNKKQSLFRFKLVDTANAAILRIDEFEGKGYETFLKNSFETLRKSNTKNLIIDLRENGGGSDYYGRLLYSYIAVKEFNYYKRLEMTIDDPSDSIFKYGKMPYGKVLRKWMRAFKLKKADHGFYTLKNSAHPNLSTEPFKPHKNNFTGNVFVLIDDKSFSATTEFCSVTHYNKRAKFIGRETGGGYCGNTSGEEFDLKLPNTKIRVAIPLIRYYSAVEGDCNHGIQPDYPFKENIDDIIFNRDPVLLFTLGLTQQNK